jgi:hypothetical protein
VEVVPGLLLPASVDVKVEDWRGVDLTAKVTFHTGRAAISELTMTQREGGPPVTGELMRLLSVKAFVKQALGHAWNELVAQSGWLVNQDPAVTALRSEHDVAWGLLNITDRDRMRETGPADETLQWVALVYRVALLLEEPPTKSVSGAFGIAQSTAGQWVAAARRKGFLGPSEGSGKAGG